MFSAVTNRRGLTLIELMIIMVIIGILASLAIPRFINASARAKQSEARQTLKQVYIMQKAYYTAKGQLGDDGETYGDHGSTATAGGSFPQIGVEVVNGALYTYQISAGKSTFTCTATANIDDDETIDTWTVDQTGVVTNTINDVTD